MFKSVSSRLLLNSDKVQNKLCFGPACYATLYFAVHCNFSLVHHYSTMEMRLVTLSLILTAVAADNASSLRLKRKTTTVAEIDSFFNQVDSKNGMVKAENIETYPWTTKQQFSMDPVSTEPRAPPTLSPVAVTEDCQNVDREEAMLDVLSDLTPTEQLTNSITPQGMAYQWILKG
jgi:hypothetical protein